MNTLDPQVAANFHGGDRTIGTGDIPDVQIACCNL
jgi:hypothetical protein